MGEDYPSEISLGGGITKKEDTNIVNTKISECIEGSDKATLFQIIFLEGWGRGIFGGLVDGGAIFCMLLLYRCNTVSHTRSRGTGAYIPRGNKGECEVMDPSSPLSSILCFLPSSVEWI